LKRGVFHADKGELGFDPWSYVEFCKVRDNKEDQDDDNPLLNPNNWFET